MFETETVNITLKIPKQNVLGLRRYLEEHLEVISYRTLPDTEQMYNDDDHFKKLVKAVKKAQRVRDDYIFKK